jgi:hypothetical protein
VRNLSSGENRVRVRQVRHTSFQNRIVAGFPRAGQARRLAASAFPREAARLCQTQSGIDRSMSRPLLSTCALLALTAGLGACASQRFDGPSRGRAGPGPQAALEAVPAMPSGPVTSAPLAPPPGASAAPSDEPPPAGGVAVAPGTPVIAEQPTYVPPPPPPVVSSGRSAVVGSWTAKDATGATCRVSLSSAPALDLYKASASGCPNKDLAKVTAWDFRDGEVYLYQPGGTVTARLRQGGGALDGALSKSGASLALVR